MKPPVCDSAFDVAFWIIDRALGDAEYAQPQKIQSIMYLAQAYYGAAANGQMLMPCLFVTSYAGPVEPTTFRAFENGRPFVDSQPIPAQQKHFLDSVWRRFGSHSTDYLNKLVTNHPPYVEALGHGKRSVISYDSMVSYYGRRRAPATGGAVGGAAGREAPGLEAVLRPQVMRSHTGKPVNVHRWMPKRKDDGRKDGG